MKIFSRFWTQKKFQLWSIFFVKKAHFFPTNNDFSRSPDIRLRSKFRLEKFRRKAVSWACRLAAVGHRRLNSPCQRVVRYGLRHGHSLGIRWLQSKNLKKKLRYEQVRWRAAYFWSMQNNNLVAGNSTGMYILDSKFDTQSQEIIGVYHEVKKRSLMAFRKTAFNLDGARFWCRTDKRCGPGVYHEQGERK